MVQTKRRPRTIGNVPVEDAAGLKALLAAILGVHRVVAKQREIFLVDNVRIHLDRVEGLGDFLELEAVFDGSPAAAAEQPRKVERLMRELGVRAEDLLAESYEQLLAADGPRPGDPRPSA